MLVKTNSWQRIFAVAIFAGALTNAALWGQTFNSRSTGADGALAFPNAKPGDVIIFDPSSFPTPLDPEHDNVYNFTTITIPQGVTVKLSAQNLGGPIYWLASGAVDIEGTLDLSGGQGYPTTNLISQRIASIPGPGGFPGGVGGNGGPGSSYPVEPGQGPAGGSATCQAPIFNYGGGGGFSANQFLVPLIGGSGGAGSNYQALFGSGGGAGGGAILVASSVSITINGTIMAVGGNGGDTSPSHTAGGGAGGAIHLMAPTIQGAGVINASPGAGSGNGGCPSAQAGLVRIEAFNQLFSGTLRGGQASGTPYNTFVPNAGTTPKLTVASVNNVPVSPNPIGNFTNPDVTFSASGAVPVVIHGANIPAGTQVNLQIYSENAPDIVMPNAGALAGSLASSTVTVMVNLPPGFSRGFISASFSPANSGQSAGQQSAQPKPR